MYNALQDSTIAGAIASSTLSTLFALALLASGQNSTIYRYFDWTDRYGRFLAYEITTVDYPCRNTDFCLASCDYSWTSRKNLGLVIGLFTGLSFNRSSILDFSLNLSDF